MDFVLALLPWTVVWGLTMRKTEKIGVAVAMSMGVLYVPARGSRRRSLPVVPCADKNRVPSAGVTGIIKTAKFPAMLSPDFGTPAP